MQSDTNKSSSSQLEPATADTQASLTPLGKGYLKALYINDICIIDTEQLAEQLLQEEKLLNLVIVDLNDREI